MSDKAEKDYWDEVSDLDSLRPAEDSIEEPSPEKALKYFSSMQACMGYTTSELMATLADDIERSFDEDSEEDAEDIQVLRDKIADIALLRDALARLFI